MKEVGAAEVGSGQRHSAHRGTIAVGVVSRRTGVVDAEAPVRDANASWGGVGEVGVGEVGTVEHRSADVCPIEVRSSEVGPLEIGSCTQEGAIAATSPRNPASRRLGCREIATPEIRAVERGPGQRRSTQVHAMEVG